MSAGAFHVAEQHGIVTPLGVQFVDDLSGTPIASGLDVWTWPETAPAKRVHVSLAGSATYAAHGLPGLREFEAGAGDDAFWQHWLVEEPKRRFVVEARDLEARFLPLQVRVDLPAFGRVRPICPLQLPLNRRDVVPLFSAPTRSVAGTMAVVRAELHDRSARIPAAWAVVDARLNGRTIARGMTDRGGRLALHFAYPEPLASWASPPAVLTSPASVPMLPLAEQRWPIALAVRYDRSLLRRDLAIGADGATAIREVPDLCDAFAQAPASLLADVAAPSLELTEITLRYGEATILRTANTLGHERGQVLVVTSGSPL